MAAHPDVLDTNIAERFVVGLEDVSKAHAGLTAMVKWLKENDMVGLVSRPQPKFEIIKRHHRHGNVCLSASRDCLVELECLGRWPQAYKAIVGEGEGAWLPPAWRPPPGACTARGAVGLRCLTRAPLPSSGMQA